MTTAINNANLIIGDGKYYEHGSILLENGSIASISDSPLSADHVIDATNKTITPGFIDCHVHLGTKTFANGAVSFGNENDISEGIRVVSQAQALFKSGITTARIVGTAHNADIVLRNIVATGEVSAPRIIASGSVLCITAGHGYDMGIECDTVGEIVKAARTQIKEGADWIKMMPTSGVIGIGPSTEVQLSKEQIHAVCDVGRSFGKPTCAHIMNYNALMICIEAGLTCVEHGYDMDEKAAQMMVEKEIWYIPTGVVTLMESIHFAADDPSVAKMKIAAAEAQTRVKNAMRVAIKTGVKMGVGTDTGCPFTNPDTYAYATELKLYTEAGMSNMDTLVSATLRGAELLGISDEVGTIAVGKKADLVILNGNPIDDITAAKDVEMTIHNGNVCYKK